MASFVIVTTPELAAGYELAGATTLAVDSGEAANRAVAELVARPDTAVVGVHEPFLAALDPVVRRLLDERPLPVVVALPSGVLRGALARRARLSAMLQRAIGHRIRFGHEEP